MHEVTVSDFKLPDIEDWLAGDDRTLAFQVVDDSGSGVDISNATVSWALFAREYQDDAADAIISDADSDVEVVTDSRVDTSVGEFEVRIGGSATSELWGDYTQRPEVEQSDGTVASWVGSVTITA